MNDTAMTTTLAAFGPRNEVKEMAERLRLMLPNGQHYTETEALTLAQISVAHDLDPFNGEVWLIKDEEKGKVYGALIGLKGLRKHARRQANYWGDFVRVLDPKQYNAPDGSIVFEYRMHDEVSLESWTKCVAKIMSLGIPLELAQKMAGVAPVTIGLGVWSPGDRTKMKPAQCAMFRAEKDALKRRFDVKWRIEIEGEELIMAPSLDEGSDLGTDEAEAEYTEILGDDAEAKEETSEEQILNDLGYTPDLVDKKPAALTDQPTNGKPDVYQAVVDAGLSENVHAAKTALNWCKTGYDTPLKAVEWMILYRQYKELGGSTKQAADGANTGQPPK